MKNNYGRTVVIPLHPKDLNTGVLLSILRQSGLYREDLIEYFKQ
ncbi:Uncharacterised protein [Candidatus Gugararchaeum adminiculabundum]|nr:Uncharacterised protein [Candidatus Gugararchaeum adminiculabundum]